MLEATVAVAVLALGWLSVASVVHVSLGAEAGLAVRRAASEALDAECARLRALAFFRRSGGPGLGPSSLLTEVFPHARPWLNADEAAYSAEAGEFRTAGEVQGLRLSRTAQFRGAAGSGLEPLPAAAELGWAVWDASRPPAAIVSVRLAVTGPGELVTTRELVVYGVRPVLQGALVASRGLGRAG